MSADCIVCRGSKRIRVPVYHPFVAQMQPDMAADLEIGESSREYPCPECSTDDAVPFTRLMAIKERVDARHEYSTDPRFIEAVHGGIANAIARSMLRDGLVTFKQTEPDARGIFSISGRADVVSPRHVAKFEERVAERQFEVAEAVAKEACAGINVWGSHYGHTMVHKAQATQSVFAALKAVRAKYARQ